MWSEDGTSEQSFGSCHQGGGTPDTVLKILFSISCWVFKSTVDQLTFAKIFSHLIFHCNFTKMTPLYVYVFLSYIFLFNVLNLCTGVENYREPN